ncbi:MAG: hypothetical protein ACKVOK_14005 [Flavobacteriales bacterium]
MTGVLVMHIYDALIFLLKSKVRYLSFNKLKQRNFNSTFVLLAESQRKAPLQQNSFVVRYRAGAEAELLRRSLQRRQEPKQSFPLVARFSANGRLKQNGLGVRCILRGLAALKSAPWITSPTIFQTQPTLC